MRTNVLSLVPDQYGSPFGSLHIRAQEKVYPMIMYGWRRAICDCICACTPVDALEDARVVGRREALFFDVRGKGGRGGGKKRERRGVSQTTHAQRRYHAQTHARKQARKHPSTEASKQTLLGTPALRRHTQARRPPVHVRLCTRVHAISKL